MVSNITCPTCQKRLRLSDQTAARTVICPNCLNEVENPAAGPDDRTPTMHRDIRWYARATSWILLVLIGLCGVGVALSIVQFSSAKGSEAGLESLLRIVGCIGLLCILVFLTANLLLWRFVTAGRAMDSARWILGLLALTLGTGFAAVVFLFTACMVLANRPYRP